MATHNIGIRKKSGWYMIQYPDGMEDRAVEVIMSWAEDPASDFTWTDAANMSWKVVDNAGGRFDTISDQQTKLTQKGGI